MDGFKWVVGAGLNFGSKVRRVQQRLIELGFKIGADGIYGSDTQGAVIEFQARCGLPADGICGPDTFAKLWRSN